MKFQVMRGLLLPDPNFIFGIGDGSTNTGWDTAGIVTEQRGNDPTSLAGVYDRVTITGASLGSGDRIFTGVTPRGVGAGPWVSGAERMTMWLGALVKTSTWLGNTNGPIWAQALDTLDNGQPGNSSGLVELKDVDRNRYIGSDEFTLVYGVAAWDADPDSVWYKMEIAFRDLSVGSDNYLDITWAGMGPIINVSAAVDELESFFEPASVDGMNAPNRSRSPAGTIRPRAAVGTNPILPRFLNVSFPFMKMADRRHLEECFQWTKGTATQNVLAECDTSKCNVFDRGSQQPIIVAFSKQGLKQVMYADMPSLTFTQALDYFPNINAQFNCQVNFQEVTQ